MLLFIPKLIPEKIFDFYGNLSKKAMLFVKGNRLPISAALYAA